MNDQANENLIRSSVFEQIEEVLHRSEEELKVVAKFYRQRGFNEQADEIYRMLSSFHENAGRV
jgi:hypothetical protein